MNINLTKVRPLFTLSHRGSDNSPLLIVFSANYIDQSNRKSHRAIAHLVGIFAYTNTVFKKTKFANFFVIQP